MELVDVTCHYGNVIQGSYIEVIGNVYAGEHTSLINRDSSSGFMSLLR